MNITLTEEQYTALVALARNGVTGQDRTIRLEQFLLDIEKSNGINRYLLWVLWQETDNIMPPTTRFPESWPPTQKMLLERIDRPIAETDVEALLKANARKPVNVLVTPDPAGIVGWTQYAVYFDGT